MKIYAVTTFGGVYKYSWEHREYYAFKEKAEVEVAKIEKEIAEKRKQFEKCNNCCGLSLKRVQR